ncbi:hypothetical protein LIER_39560 [Lithospermum erythrorhizon]|uniref:Uncharacterized protein n=1 Tax=Lithospermum erythrorhizon TaxID=34254 RepID=A0AAV3QJR7_LITER
MVLQKVYEVLANYMKPLANPLQRIVQTPYKVGNEIAATVFVEHIHFVTPTLSLFKVYDITNAYVKFVPPKFRITNSQ